LHLHYLVTAYGTAELQAEALRMALHSPDNETMSRLWSALQARYRPTLAIGVRAQL
jgi:hypothetical protein